MNDMIWDENLKQMRKAPPKAEEEIVAPPGVPEEKPSGIRGERPEGCPQIIDEPYGVSDWIKKTKENFDPENQIRQEYQCNFPEPELSTCCQCGKKYTERKADAFRAPENKWCDECENGETHGGKY